MKKIIILIGFIVCFSINSKAEFYYNVCRIKVDNGGGLYGNIERSVEDVKDIYGVLIGQNVTIYCSQNGASACPITIAPPPGGGGYDIDNLPANVFLSCQQMFEDLCDGIDDELFPNTVNILGSDNVVYHVSAAITEIVGGKKYNLVISAN